MIVVMVDDRAMRFRQQGTSPAPGQPRSLSSFSQPVVQPRQPRPTPQPVAPRPVEPTPFEKFAEAYARGNQRRVDDIVKYGGETSGLGSRTADLLVSGGVSDSPGLRAGALAGDILLDPGWLVPGVGAVKGAQVAGRAVKDPTVHARTNALLGRLYHGNRNEPWNVAQTRPFEGRAGNWFSADLFSTPDFKLASSYGPNAVFSLKNLPPNLKVLDLMPGGKTVAEQSPELARALSNLPSMGGNAPFDDVADAARHTTLTNLPNDQLAQLMQQQGFNALRHVSGQGLMAGKGRAKPVYAFFDPAGITANPVSPLNRAVNQAGEVISDIPGVTRRVAENVGNRFVDSVDEALRKSDSSNPRVQQFLAERGNVAPGFTSSSGIARRLVVDPATGKTSPVVYKPYPAVSGAIETLGKPAQAVRNARQASSNAYQRALEEYSALERANRQNFIQNYPNPSNLPYGGNLLGAPMPPGYAPLTRPAEPGALDFLQYLFNTTR